MSSSTPEVFRVDTATYLKSEEIELLIAFICCCFDAWVMGQSCPKVNFTAMNIKHYLGSREFSQSSIENIEYELFLFSKANKFFTANLLSGARLLLLPDLVPWSNDRDPGEPPDPASDASPGPDQ